MKWITTNANERGQLLGLAAAIVALFASGAILIPRIGLERTALPLVVLCALANLSTVALVRYMARRRP